MLGHLEGVVVDDTDGEDRPRQFRRVQLRNHLPDDPDTVQLVAVARRLHVQRPTLLCPVDDRHRQSDSGPVTGLADLKAARVHFAGGGTRRTQRRH